MKQAVTDIPAVLFTDELLEAYPEAKVILTSRDVDFWLHSVTKVFYLILSWWGWRPLQSLDPSFTKLYIPLLRLPLQVWGHSDTTSTALPDPERLRAGFDEHYAHIRKVVPKGKLLEWHPRDGWEPLCRYLEVDMPEEVKGKPFPKINDPTTTLGILGMLYMFRWIAVGFNLAKWAAVCCLCYVVWTYWGPRTVA